jgi:DNA-binding response OmpR family regulator
VPTVLIADDNADHRELLSHALRRSGHEVVTAVDADTALSALRTGAFDAALLDVRMPGESGIELCRRLRAQPETAIIPVMLISADVHRALDGLHAGADDYLTKPFHRAELCARLDNLLRSRPDAVSKGARAASAAMLAVRTARRTPSVVGEPARRTA